MIITRNSEHALEFKTKEAAIKVNTDVVINDVKIAGPGEYDVAKVSVIGFPTKTQTVYLLAVDDVTVCYFSVKPEKLATDVIEKMGNVEMLVVTLCADTTPEEVVNLINALEPNVVMPIGDKGAVEKLMQTSGADNTEIDSYKITKSTLPADDRQMIVLKSGR
ncbi:MAG: MBL fold metallo-hydrolase [Patescibacteria group bacterium]|jgi:hypothetical protein